MDTIGDVLADVQARLKGISATARLDAQLLIAQLLNRPRAWVLAHPEAPVSTEDREGLEAATRRREAGEPLPYILGHWEFYGLDFRVTPDTLIPRPETELLVDTALEWLRQSGKRRAADVGTGSGCIAISLAANLPEVRVVATDISPAALDVARENAVRHGVAERIDFQVADLLPAGSPVDGPLDLICANLPYIPRHTLAGLEVSRWEPRLALDGGEDGLDLVRRLLDLASARLAPGAALLLEIEASQGESARQAAVERYPDARVDVLKDLAGMDRLLRILV